MQEPERRRVEDNQAIGAGEVASVRPPGDCSSPNAPSPSEAPTVPAGDTSAGSRRMIVLPQRTEESGTDVLQQHNVLGQRYEILALLGQGGMGAVYKAKDREVDQFVALKVIRPELANNPALIARFKQELILARQVTHKNVIRIYDLAEADGIKFLTMEYVEGKDLRSIIWEKRKVAPEETAEIMRQVCLALEAAHTVGVIHRDLKPQNIMRDTSGRVLVMDFGLARTVEGAGMTQTGAMVGTLEYMSPEQGLGKSLDQRSDLFAVGLIFYELLTGKMPYRAESALASLIRRTHEAATPVSEEDSSIPQALSAVVSRCLERDPNMRYQHASEIAADLAAWQSKANPAQRLATVLRADGERGSRWWARAFARPLLGSTLAVLVGSLLAILVLAVAGFLFRSRFLKPPARLATAPSAASLAILPFHNASGDPDLDWLGSSLGEMLTTDVGYSPGLRTVSSDRVSQVLADERVPPGSAIDASLVPRLAELSRAETVVWGQYAKSGEQIRIDATLLDVNHQRRLTLTAEASGQEDLLPAVDRLARSVRENLALSPQLVKELQEQAFRPSTSSLVALHSYDQGVELFRHGHSSEALKRFQDSVKADSQFALAYSKLGKTYASLGYDKQAEQAARKATDLSGGLPTREKDLISANEASIINDKTTAIQAYEKLIKTSPDDTDVLFDLAALYSSAGSFDKARELYSRVLEENPKNVPALLDRGRLEIRSDNSQGSLEYLNRALSLAIETDNQEQRAAILHAIGVAYRVLNKAEDAQRYLQDSLAIKRHLNAKKSMAISLNELALVQASMGTPEASLASYREALQLRREIGDQKGVGDTLIDLGGYYLDGGKYNEALKLFKESLQIQRDTGNENYEALCLNNIGDAYLAKGDYNDARTYLEQALAIRKKLNVPSDTADTLHNLAETSTKTGQLDKALDQYLQALQLYRNTDDKNGAAKEAYSMGTVFEYQGRYGAAVSSKQDALKTFQELKDRSFWMAEILGGYGHGLAQAGRGAEAQQYFDEALVLARELKNQTLIAQTLDFEGDALFYRGDLGGARRMYEQAQQAASHSNDRHAMLLANLDLLKIDAQRPAPKNVITGLRAAGQEADALGLKYLSIEASVYLAEAELAGKDYIGARKGLERTLTRSEQLGLRALSAQAHYLLATALRISGNHKEAALHYRDSVLLLDTIGKEAGSEKVLQRSDLNSIYSGCTQWLKSSQR